MNADTIIELKEMDRYWEVEQEERNDMWKQFCKKTQTFVVSCLKKMSP